ncbi:MAG: ribokinase [Treponema sp.]
MKILNFGSLNIDYVYSVDHFVRGGETLSSGGLDVFADGKGLNQSIALARALTGVPDIELFHAGGIGRHDGQFLKQLLAQAGVNTHFIQEHAEPSGHTVIQLDSSGKNCILLHGGANQLHSDSFIDSVLSSFSAGDYLVLQNEINNIGIIMAKANARGMKIIFNPSPYSEKINTLPLELVSCFVVNEVEAADITRLPLSSAPKVLFEMLQSAFGRAKVALTLGKSGVIYADGARIYTHGIYDVPVTDTTGAGDTFTGYFIACLAQNMPPERALELASKASSLAVSKKGAAPSIPTISEVLTADLKYIPAKWEL